MNLSKLCTALVVASAVAIPATTQATNGYFAIGYGMKSKGMGGAAIANPQDALAAAANPAGMAEVGTRVDVGAELFNPPRKVAAEGGEFEFQTPTKDSATVSAAKSGSNLFLIPNMGGNFQFTRNLTVGMAAIGNGANTRYSDNFFQLTGVPPNEPYGTLGVQLIQMQMLPTVTYRLNKNHAVGGSLAIGVQQFRAYGLGNFGVPGSDLDFQFSADDSRLTNQGNDYAYGFGARFGWLGHFLNKRLSLGAMYASRVDMSKFRQYRGLFADQGDFDIPENFGIGLAVRPTKRLTVAVDVTKILYSDIPAVGDPHPTTSIQDPCTRPIGFTGACTTPGATPQPTDKALGAGNSFGFGWNDQTVYKIGASYQVNDKWTVRAGYNYGESPIPDNQILFSLIAPATTERHATVGFTYAPDQRSEISMSYVYAFKHSQVCQAPDCVTMFTQQPGSYAAAQMYIQALGISYGLKW